MNTILNNITNEIIVKKSKFITILKTINSEEEGLNIIKNIKHQYKHATHYCYAYIIDNIKRYNDDKEPSGTAGIPILEGLEQHQLNYILCIIIRYYGGIKLGANNLTRTYRNSVLEALKLAQIASLIKGKEVIIKFKYEDQQQVDKILKDIIISNRQYDQIITYQIEIELTKIATIKQQLLNIPNIIIDELKDINIKKTSK